MIRADIPSRQQTTPHIDQTSTYTLPQLPLQTGFAIAQIFQFKKSPLRKGQTAPRLNETMPLTLFYHADEYVDKCVNLLSKLQNIRTLAFTRRNEKLHTAQRNLLDAIYVIYADIDSNMKSPRDYVQQLPPDDQRELQSRFSENILFASQALSKGYRIRGIEQYTSELVEPAKGLNAAMGALRHVFRSRVVVNPAPPYTDLNPVLKDFDIAWTAFEKKICFFYFSATYTGLPSRIDETHLFQVLMSETIIRALDQAYISVEQVQCFDPSLILAIPRLTLFSALYYSPDMVNLTDSQNAFRWFRSSAPILKRTKEQIKILSQQEIYILESMLADIDPRKGNDTVLEDECGGESVIKELYLDICAVSDNLIRSKEFVAMLSKVFAMHTSRDDMK